MSVPTRAGARYGRLIVLGFSKRVGEYSYLWNTRCDCGNEKTVEGRLLRSGRTRSCGCLRSENTAKMKTTHGACYTKENACWRMIRSRCESRTNPRYSSYGGRGIKVCVRWQVFANFLADMGERPDWATSIDRIDNNGDYEPSNCRWATNIEQARNRRSNKIVNILGHAFHVVDAESALGLRQGHIYDRASKRGETQQQAVDHFVARKFAVLLNELAAL